MINGNLNDFVDGVYYGYEQEFTYRGLTFFIQSLPLDDGCIYLLLDRWNPPADDYILKLPMKDGIYPAEEFLNAPIWDGRTFWEAEGEMEWVG